VVKPNLIRFVSVAVFLSYPLICFSEDNVSQPSSDQRENIRTTLIFLDAYIQDITQDFEKYKKRASDYWEHNLHIQILAPFLNFDWLNSEVSACLLVAKYTDENEFLANSSGFKTIEKELFRLQGLKTAWIKRHGQIWPSYPERANYDLYKGLTHIEEAELKLSRLYRDQLTRLQTLNAAGKQHDFSMECAIRLQKLYQDHPKL